MGETLQAVYRVLARRKTASCPGDGGQALGRCLTVLDVTCLGLTTILGTGIYMLLAVSAKEHAGPSVVLSFLVASVASCLGGLCYSELATRFPRGGSAYVYTYATTGEFCAFIVAWGMVFEYTAGCALAAKAWSYYINVLSNDTLTYVFGRSLGHLTLPGLDSTPDVLAMAPILFVSVLVMSKTKLSCVINNVLIVLNLLVLIGVVLVSIFNMDTENWLGGGGFFSNGVAGVFCGSSACFFAFLGYDIIASSTGEMVHRSRILPAAVSFTFLVGLVSCFTVAASITLLVPSALLDFRGPLLQAFDIRKIHGMPYIVIIGATSGLTAAVIGCLFALSRLLQSMANDGLIFRFLAQYNENTETGWTSTVIGGFVSALVAVLGDGETLIHLLGMGTIVSFVSIAIAVLCLRYGVAERLPLECGELSRDSTATLTQGSSYYGITHLYANQDYSPDRSECYGELNTSGTEPPEDQDVTFPKHLRTSQRDYGSVHGRPLAVELVNDTFVTSITDLSLPQSKPEPTGRSAATTAVLVSCIVVLMTVTGLLTVHVPRMFSGSRWWMEVVACILFLVLVAFMVLVVRQPRHRTRVKNAVPCVPLLPVCAIWMDLHLLVCLPYTAWLTFLVWTLIGMLVYMGYSVWNSSERSLDDIREMALSDVNEDCDESSHINSQREVLVETC